MGSKLAACGHVKQEALDEISDIIRQQAPQKLAPGAPAPEEAVHDLETEVEEEIDESLEKIDETLVMWLRRYPQTWVCMLVLCCLVLKLGQLATTIWWLLGFTRFDIIVLVSSCVATSSLACYLLTPLKAASSIVSLCLTGLMVLDVYCAVSLLVGAGDDTSCKCWEALHLAAFFFISATYLAEALPHLLSSQHILEQADSWLQWLKANAEPVLPQRLLGKRVAVLRWLEACLQWLEGRMKMLVEYNLYGCGCFACLYLVAACLGGSERACALSGQKTNCVARSPLDRHALLWSLHVLGIICTKLLSITEDAFPKELLYVRLHAGKWLIPHCRQVCVKLFGKAIAEKVLDKLVRVIDKQLASLKSPTVVGPSWRTNFSFICSFAEILIKIFLDRVPEIRNVVPSVGVVEYLVAFRRMAPIIAPLLPVIKRLFQLGWVRVSQLLVVALCWGFAEIWKEVHDKGSIPQSSSMRLWFLVPHTFIDESTQGLLGGTMVTAKYARRVKRGIKAMCVWMFRFS